MKTFFNQIVIAVAIFSLTLSISYGQNLSLEDRDRFNVINANLETLQISDLTNDTNLGTPNPLYRIFNEYFANELETPYTSGNELANDRMIRQSISSWNVNPGSNVVASFTSSAWSHGMQIYTATGELVFDSGMYGSTTTGEAIIDGQVIPLAGDSYVLSINSYGASKAFSGDHDWYYSTNEYLDDSTTWQHYYENGIQHIIALDVTDLMSQRSGYENIESAFLFAFEDLADKILTDFDYQDFGFILTNVQANVATPEPATALIVSIVGACTLPLLRRRKKILKSVVDSE